MNEALSTLIGKQVQVTSFSNSTHFTDKGILESYDHPWLRLRKGGNKVLCLPVFNIRLVESIDG